MRYDIERLADLQALAQYRLVDIITISLNTDANCISQHRMKYMQQNGQEQQINT